MRQPRKPRAPKPKPDPAFDRVRLIVGVERTPQGDWWVFSGPRDRVNDKPVLVQGTGSDAFRTAVALLKRRFIEVFAPKEDG